MQDGDLGADQPATSDAELLRAHVEGDPQAFNELVRRHRDRLWAVALRTIGDREEAADAVQDALLSAHRGAAGLHFREAGGVGLRIPGSGRGRPLLSGERAGSAFAFRGAARLR